MISTQTGNSATNFVQALDSVGGELDELASLHQINRCNKREVLLHENRVNRIKHELKKLQISLDTFKSAAKQATKMNEENQNQLQALQHEKKKLKITLKNKNEICKAQRQKLRKLVGDGLLTKQSMGEIGLKGSLQNKIQFLQAEVDEIELKIIQNQSLIEQFAFLNNEVKLLQTKEAMNLLQKSKAENLRKLESLNHQMLQMAREQQNLRKAIGQLEIQINQLEQKKSQNEWNANQLERLLEDILDDDERQVKIFNDDIKLKKEDLAQAQKELTEVQIADEQFEEKIKSKTKQLKAKIKTFELAKENLLKISTPKEKEVFQKQFNQFWKRFQKM